MLVCCALPYVFFMFFIFTLPEWRSLFISLFKKKQHFQRVHEKTSLVWISVQTYTKSKASRRLILENSLTHTVDLEWFIKCHYHKHRLLIITIISHISVLPTFFFASSNINLIESYSFRRRRIDSKCLP